ncbi:MAG TPA: LuxR C-terminal-related transcriptional regulator [Phycisphaerae bacterium]|nr:LuxR C-terminal-related transcriptional regulator [Phycisphaerae bacterium]
MQHDPTSSSALPDPQGGHAIAPPDAVQFLQLMGALGSLRNDPRAWRQELLGGINRILPASVSAAFILRGIRAESAPAIATHFDAGFQSHIQRQAFFREINTAPLQDPLGRFALRRFVSGGAPTLTFVRSDAIDDDGWNSDLHVLTHRKASGMDDCLVSIHRAAEPATAYVLCVLRAAVSRGSEGAAAGGKTAPPPRFGPRERLLVDTLHRGLDWLYSGEETAHRLNQASALSKRVRQTLDYLLAADTERQIATKMSISVHTVHDYVKTVYAHFGVSSRRELMARWIQIGGHVQKKDETE